MHKFANIVIKIHERRVPEIKGEKKGRKYLFGPNVFMWNILEKKNSSTIIFSTSAFPVA